MRQQRVNLKSIHASSFVSFLQSAIHRALCKRGMAQNYKFKLHSSIEMRACIYQMYTFRWVCVCVYVFFESVQHELHRAIGKWATVFLHLSVHTEVHILKFNFCTKKSPTIRAFIEIVSHIDFLLVLLLLYNNNIIIILHWPLAETGKFVYYMH